MPALALSSAAGVVGLLAETDVELQVYALEQLDALVPAFWAEVADALPSIETLYEDEGFPRRGLAALVASKVYFNLGEFNEALTFALGAGAAFDVAAKDLYTQTIIAKCIDRYCALKTAQSETADPANAGESIDARLEDIVERMFQRCFRDGEFKQAIGIALEARRLDVLQEAIKRSGSVAEMLAYALDVANTLVLSRKFRSKVLPILVNLYRSLADPDYESVARCLVFLNDAAGVADLLHHLHHGDADHQLMLHQLCFDLYDNATQQFLKQVLELFYERKGLSGASAAVPTSAASSAAGTDPALAAAAAAAAPQATGEATAKPVPPEVKKIEEILSGRLTIGLHMEFLFRNNKTDLAILKNTKTAVEARSSVFHVATICTHGLMHAGTSVDQFLRDNLEWLGRATNWSKFTAVASLGVIHRGHISQGLALLSPYLPKEGGGATGSPYSEGGALYALGLIHANHGAEVVPYLLKAMSSTENETILHGACLGMGVAAMASGDSTVYDQLQKVLYMDSAVAGEAAGLAIGMVMLGSASLTAVNEMLQYAQETPHEKIIRGAAIGLALVMYQTEESAESLIDRLASDKDPILRYGGMYTVGMAYAGSANNTAIRRLLHVAVSDVSDDVRRAAVIALGFVLFRRPEQCPPMVQLLAESYNPHVRYGATIALGIACAGTGLQAAVDLLEPMAEDSVDFVRQGALIALAMILIQHNETSAPKAPKVRKLYERIIGDKHEDAMAKYGAILAQGIIDAGGRNVTISLQSTSGHARMLPIVGLVLFTQYWYWYPLVNMLSLAFSPTAVIGLNKNHDMPKVQFVSHVKPSLFAYPPPLAPPTTEKVEKVATAVLSTTAKAKARAQAKEAKERGSDKMDVDGAAGKKPEGSEAAVAQEKMDVDMATPTEGEKAAGGASAGVAPAEGEKKKEKPKPEPTSETLENPARVLPAQAPYVKVDDSARYKPMKRGVLSDIVMLKDTQAGTEEAIVSLSVPKIGAGGVPEEQEPSPPEPFQYVE